MEQDRKDRRKTRGAFPGGGANALCSHSVTDTSGTAAVLGSCRSDNAKYPGIIKTESASMFSRMYCRDVKWIFYIYSLNRRCVLVGQPCYAVAKQPEAHMHKAHVPCDAQAEL